MLTCPMLWGHFLVLTTTTAGTELHLKIPACDIELGAEVWSSRELSCIVSALAFPLCLFLPFEWVLGLWAAKLFLGFTNQPLINR